MLIPILKNVPTGTLTNHCPVHRPVWAGRKSRQDRVLRIWDGCSGEGYVRFTVR